MWHKSRELYVKLQIYQDLILFSLYLFPFLFKKKSFAKTIFLCYPFHEFIDMYYTQKHFEKKTLFNLIGPNILENSPEINLLVAFCFLEIPVFNVCMTRNQSLTDTLLKLRRDSEHNLRAPIHIIFLTFGCSK